MLHSSGKENKLFMILDFLHKKNFDAVVEKRAFSQQIITQCLYTKRR